VSAQAQRGYEGYAASTGGKTFDGRPMPAWHELPPRIQEAWRDAIVAAVDSPAKEETLTDKQVRLLDEMGTVGIGKKLKDMMPPGRGFLLFTVDYGKNGTLAYFATVHRDDAIRLCREWLKSKGAL
jgi:hypothetical protein